MMNAGKSKFTYLFLFGLACSMLMSCEKWSYYQVPDEEQKIVMNGILSPDFGLWMNLSRSVNITEMYSKSYIPVQNATIQFYENGVFITAITENQEGNYWETDFKPELGNIYEFVVSAPSMPVATTNVKIPEPVEIVSLDTMTVVRETIIYPGNIINKKIGFYIKLSYDDPAEESNFYMLSVKYDEVDEPYEVNLQTEDIDVNTYIKDAVNILAWNDENHNGGRKELHVSFELKHNQGFCATFEIILYSIEEDYFKYLKSYSQNFTVLNDESLFSEAVPVISNVTGGLGVLAAVSTSRKYFDYQF